MSGCTAETGQSEEELDTEAMGASEAALSAGGRCAPGMTRTTYDCIDPWAEWIMPNPEALSSVHVQRLSVTSAGIAYDPTTGLRWQRVPTVAATWADAHAACRRLVVDGQRGWRLPTRIELISISGYPDSDAFPGNPSGAYWTASELAGHPGISWTVFLGTSQVVRGTDPYAGQTNLSLRCVKGAPHPRRQARYVISDETVYDRRTHLTWQRGSGPVWQRESADYCPALTIAGGGWRAPTYREFQTLIDETRDAPAFDPEAFPDPLVHDWFFVEPLYPLSSSAWMVHASGSEYDDVAVNEELIRCVR